MKKDLLPYTDTLLDPSDAPWLSYFAQWADQLVKQTHALPIFVRHHQPVATLDQNNPQFHSPTLYLLKSEKQAAGLCASWITELNGFSILTKRQTNF